MVAALWKHKSLVIELTKREFSGRYRGSFGGVLWSLVQPLFMLAVYTIAFGVLLQVRWGLSENTYDYALKLFAGLIIFNALMECLNKAPALIYSNPNFVKKIVFPLELLPVVMVATAMLHALIGLSAWFVAYTLLLGLPGFGALMFPLVLIAYLPVLLGVGWLLSAVGVIIKDVSQVAGVLGHALLFLTPIFYSVEILPLQLQKLLYCNPLTFVVEQFRRVLFEGQLDELSSLVMYFIMACVFSSLCFALFKRLRPSFADMV